MSDVVINRTTYEAFAVPSLDIYPVEEWVHNPDLSGVNDVDKIYWKVIDDTVVEMTQEEKDIIDASIDIPIEYIIEEDSDADKDFRSINYKTELKTGVSYNPVFTFHTSGAMSGLIEKTDYYKNFVDMDNPGTLVIRVEEVYTLEDAPQLYNSGRAILSRIKTWKYATIPNGDLDEENVKTKVKLYDTRKKRHDETVRRRNNILEQLIDNVGLAGVLSGTFADVTDAHENLTEIQIVYSAAMDAWLSSGHGTVYDDIANDTQLPWLEDTVADNPYTQAKVPWMIGIKYKDYIVDKIKGNIQ